VNHADQTDSSRVPGLDLLRFAAVGAVILYHYGFWGPASHGVPQVALPVLAPVAQYGFLGVPVFFAISGFVIAYSAEGRTPVGFAIARFSRIYPTFVFCMTLTFAATVLFGAGHFEVTASQWLANLFIAAPFLGQAYVDTSYWSLVIEVVFYGWVAAFIALGLFPRRIDALIVAWLAITFANELTIDAPIFEKLFIADDSGFFAVGLLIYQHYRGRSDTRLWALLASALGTAIFQAVHKLERLGVHTHGSFDPKVVAVICALSARDRSSRDQDQTSSAPGCDGGRRRRRHLSALSTPYAARLRDPHAIDTQRHTLAVTSAVVLGAFVLAYVVWRCFERLAQRRIKTKLSSLATRYGWSSDIPITSSTEVRPV
jgi:peptidoglycan/LPS O-acetylase OafA/YrhL